MGAALREESSCIQRGGQVNVFFLHATGDAARVAASFFGIQGDRPPSERTGGEHWGDEQAGRKQSHSGAQKVQGSHVDTMKDRLRVRAPAAWNDSWGDLLSAPGADRQDRRTSASGLSEMLRSCSPVQSARVAPGNDFRQRAAAGRALEDPVVVVERDRLAVGIPGHCLLVRSEGRQAVQVGPVGLLSRTGPRAGHGPRHSGSRTG